METLNVYIRYIVPPYVYHLVPVQLVLPFPPGCLPDNFITETGPFNARRDLVR